MTTYQLYGGRKITVPEPFYLGSCDACGHIGSTGDCPPDQGWGDDDVLCPKCYRSGFDCGKIAEGAKEVKP